MPSDREARNFLVQSRKNSIIFKTEMLDLLSISPIRTQISLHSFLQ